MERGFGACAFPHPFTLSLSKRCARLRQAQPVLAQPPEVEDLAPVGCEVDIDLDAGTADRLIRDATLVEGEAVDLRPDRIAFRPGLRRLGLDLGQPVPLRKAAGRRTGHEPVGVLRPRGAALSG